MSKISINSIKCWTTPIISTLSKTPFVYQKDGFSLVCDRQCDLVAPVSFHPGYDVSVDIICPDKTFYPYPEAYFIAGYLVILLFSILSCIGLGIFWNKYYSRKLKDNLKLIQV